jgi:ATP-dependent Clp protease ATP-binding subunit ClpA
MNDRSRFDKFTDRARKALSLAQEEAQRFQHTYIGTEHLLLGLVREGEGVAAKVLSNLGVELKDVRDTVMERLIQMPGSELTERERQVLTLVARGYTDKQIADNLYVSEQTARKHVSRILDKLGLSRHEVIIGRGDRLVRGEIGLTPRAKKVIELAVDEARRLNHPAIGTEHLLLGLVREGEGLAVGVLESLGVRLERVRTETMKMLNQQNTS